MSWERAPHLSSERPPAIPKAVHRHISDVECGLWARRSPILASQTHNEDSQVKLQNEWKVQNFQIKGNCIKLRVQKIPTPAEAYKFAEPWWT